MATPIRQEYLQFVTKLERDELLHLHEGRVANQFDDGFKVAQMLYDKAVKELHGKDLEKVKKIHAQLSVLFNAPVELGAPGMSMKVRSKIKDIQYLRIAAEHNEVQFVREYFRRLSIEERRSAFTMLCNTFGRPLDGEKTSKNGIYHIAKDPRNLLAPATSVTGSPRIIDVLLQKQLASSTPPAPESDESEYIVDTWGKRTLRPIDSKKKILAFYLNGKNDYGQTRDQMLMRSNEELLTLKEKEIRWLFPLSKDADNFSLNEDFRADRDRTRIDNLTVSFMRMLGAYGLVLDMARNTVSRNPKITITGFVKLWQTSNAPHYQHIERILSCSRSFDTFFSDAFMDALEGIYQNEGKGAIPHDMLLAWRRASS